MAAFEARRLTRRTPAVKPIPRAGGRRERGFPAILGPWAPKNTAGTKFGGYAKSTGSLHDASVGSSGNRPNISLTIKVECLARLGLGPETAILDYGCGIGSLTCHLGPRYAEVHGFDPSLESLKIARERTPQASSRTTRPSSPTRASARGGAGGGAPRPPRGAARRCWRPSPRSSHPADVLVVFEHNPYNPLTRRAVAACPFDDGAILLSPREVTRLLAATGLAEVGRTSWCSSRGNWQRLRPLEPHPRLAVSRRADDDGSRRAADSPSLACTRLDPALGLCFPVRRGTQRGRTSARTAASDSRGAEEAFEWLVLGQGAHARAARAAALQAANSRPSSDTLNSRVTTRESRSTRPSCS